MTRRSPPGFIQLPANTPGKAHRVSAHSPVAVSLTGTVHAIAEAHGGTRRAVRLDDGTAHWQSLTRCGRVWDATNPRQLERLVVLPIRLLSLHSGGTCRPCSRCWP